MTVQIVSGGELVYEPWPSLGDWHPFSGNVEDFNGLASSFDDPLTVYAQQPNVRTVVGFLARNFAQVGVHAFERMEQGRQRIRDGEIADWIGEPDEGVSMFDYQLAKMIDVALYDRWAALVVTPAGADRPVTRRLPPRRWRFVRDWLDRPIAVRLFGSDGKHVDLGPDKVVWIDGYPTPDRFSPMEHLKALLIEETESTRARADMWRRGARIGGWIERGLDAPRWTKTGRRNFKKSWADQFQLDGTNAGGTPVLEDGMTFHEAKPITSQDAQQIEARKLSMSVVAASYHVAPVLVGVLDGANYSNVTAYGKMLYRDTLGPHFRADASASNLRLLPKLGGDRKTEYFEHNVEEKLALSFEEQVGVLVSATGAPILTREEARDRWNLPYIEGTDELVIPLNVLTGGQTSPRDSAPDRVAAMLRSIAEQITAPTMTPHQLTEGDPS